MSESEEAAKEYLYITDKSEVLKLDSDFEFISLPQIFFVHTEQLNPNQITPPYASTEAFCDFLYTVGLDVDGFSDVESLGIDWDEWNDPATEIDYHAGSREASGGYFAREIESKAHGSKASGIAYRDYLTYSLLTVIQENMMSSSENCYHGSNSIPENTFHISVVGKVFVETCEGKPETSPRAKGTKQPS